MILNFIRKLKIFQFKFHSKKENIKTNHLSFLGKFTFLTFYFYALQLFRCQLELITSSNQAIKSLYLSKIQIKFISHSKQDYQQIFHFY